MSAAHSVEASGCRPVTKKGYNALVTNYRLITVLNNFSKIFESIILVHDQLSFYFKFKLHPSLHGFIHFPKTMLYNTIRIREVLHTAFSRACFFQNVILTHSAPWNALKAGREEPKNTSISWQWFSKQSPRQRIST
jgi:hypothetical protein